MLARNDGQRDFSVHSAISFGVNEAILIRFLRTELTTACQLRANGMGKDRFELVIEEDQPWMPWTLEDFARELPFWSKHQIRRIIASCKDQDLIETGNYNQSPWDQRLWYTVKGMSANDPG